MNAKLKSSLKRTAILSWQEMCGTSPRRKAMDAHEAAKLAAWRERQSRATDLIATGQATRKTVRAMILAQDRVAARKA